ncbi:hypothetical protein CWI37_2075p0010 [Hamiltosporidium tvaerminnensis]|uniref:Nuclear cap-binding protein subunit 2 n=1 Tax=Hamiltosporidium tvaerminnensis TaxID=1176355 RepID=A0A4Q9KSL4_9MICR|nr:hypothetical protein CWI37_2075p0010 [Hamiltosporidium tvaerminnensis]
MLDLLTYFIKRHKSEPTYIDPKSKITPQEYEELLKKTTTIYIGGLSSTCNEERIWEIFGICGKIRRVIMGVNSKTLEVCGFCFVEFYSREGVFNSLMFNGFRIDGCYIKVEIDYGFREGRQYGRGDYGGQVQKDKKRRKFCTK